MTPGRCSRLSEFYCQLSKMLAGGLRLLQSLELIAKSPPHYSFRRPLQRLIKQLEQGYSFHESLAMLRWLPEFDVALIQAGEESGKLDGCLRQLSDYYRERAELGRSVAGDLAYPAVLVHLGLLIFPPALLSQFVWEGLVGGSKAIIRAFLWQKIKMFAPLYLVFIVFMLSTDSTRTRGWRAVMEKLVRVVPFYGKAQRSLALGRLTSALGALLAAGVGVVRAWELAAKASGSPAVIKAVSAALPRIVGGEAPGQVIGNFRLFPELFVSLYRAGEISGKLDDSIDELRRHYLEEGSRKMRAFAQWLPRVIFIVFAIFLGYVIVTFWMGYFGGMVDSIDRATQGEL